MREGMSLFGSLGPLFVAENKENIKCALCKTPLDFILSNDFSDILLFDGL